MIVLVLFVLVFILDVITLKDVSSRQIATSMKLFWSAVVLLIPILGMSLYYFTKNN